MAKTELVADLRYTRVRTESWLKPLFTTASRFSPQPINDGHILTLEHRAPNRPTRVFMQANGVIPEHRDMTFPEWSYLFILYAGRGKRPLLWCEGYKPLHLETGMLVELNIHLPHKLEQRRRSHLIFIPFDYEKQVGFEVAKTEARTRFSPENH